MKRLTLYNSLTALDVVRLWQSVQHHVIIVAGICLPILLLLGLRNGHLADLREELLKSPTGRQVVFWSGQHGELMTMDAVEKYEKEIPGVEIVIPEIQRLVSLTSVSGETPRKVDRATLYSTRPGDPILRQYGVDPKGLGEREVALISSLAEELQVKVGDKVVATVERAREGIVETASLELMVGEIIARTGAEQNNVGYVDVNMLAAMEQYVMGYQVKMFGWPAFKISAPDRYSSYLIVCEKGSLLSDEDMRTLQERGFTLEQVNDEQTRTLHGVLKPDSLESLEVYRLSTPTTGEQQTLDLAPGQLSRFTEADDVVIPWNEPLDVKLLDREYRLVGISLPSVTWLRLYLHDRDGAFNFDADTFSVQFFDEADVPGVVEIKSASGAKIKVSAESRSTQDATEVAINTSDYPESQESAPVTISPEFDVSPEEKALDKVETAPSETSASQQGLRDSQPHVVSTNELPQSDIIETEEVKSKSTTNAMKTAIVPMDLLSLLNADKAGTVEYDPASRLFVPNAEETLFNKARLYADTIDKVPAVSEVLRERGFAIMSEVTRIREIQQQDKSLRLLVLIVGIGVFSFGVITVFSVLLDSTERKRGTIGILRVMGVSRFGVFYMIFLRAAIIGVLAAVVTISFGALAAIFFNWQPSTASALAQVKPVIHVIIGPKDIALVVIGALTCCTVGAIIPANKASRMDPFDAIVEGRFR
ncbi:ABC transporter permease [Novipirellula sp.]|uniref:ABC transporter permease n=1 Tax=Novipirellula sp. TaxID=2795430 RepID=UPI003561DA8E